MINLMRWLLVGGLSVLTGFLTVQYLVTPPLSMSRYLVGLSLAGLALGWVFWRYFKHLDLVLAIVLAAAGLITGYLVTNHLFLNHEEARQLPEINVRGASEGHTAVIYLTHGEPPAYSSESWKETFKEFDRDQAPFIPAPLRPLFFYQLRKEYLTYGGSPHNIIHQSMLNSLEERVRQDGDLDTRFYLAFLDSDPRPDEAVIRAINDGASRIILVNVFLTISSHTQAGIEYVEQLNLAQYNVAWCSAEPLWNSDPLQQMFVRRANRFLEGTDKARTAVLLVGHGQPDTWDALYPTQTEQEDLFRQSVVELLVKDGFKRENIALSWMEFKEPNTIQMAQQLGSQNVDKILVFASAISATSIHSLYDIPNAVRQATIPASVEVVNLGAWDNDPLVIQAIYEKLKACQ